ncbi:MAG: hypothetical protein GXP25_02240 [Planctomycetes bacterium]|nr:hypothetical protein [Planctomycetota bacterium]
MFSNPRHGVIFTLTLFCILQGGVPCACAQVRSGAGHAAKPPAKAENLFTNPGFEVLGPGGGGWRMDKGGKTVARFAVDREDAAEGEYSARVTIDRVEKWGTQFGQGIKAGKKGKTYTFAVLAKATKEPATVNLQIERRGKPYDRAAKSEMFTLQKDKWTELHTTFKVEKDFPQGWFAYISCTQPNSEYRADMFRLYEGEYVPYKEIAKQELAAHRVRLFDTGGASSEPLSSDAMAKKNGWTEVAEDRTGYAFKGDACMTNNYLALVLRKGAKGAEWYYCLGGQMVKGPTLVPVGAGGDRARAIESFQVVENTPAKALLEVSFATISGRKIVTRYLLKRKKPIVETQPGEGTEEIAVETQSKYAVLPDVFGWDLVVRAEKCGPSQLRFPSENVVAQLTDDGNAIVLCVWRSRDQRVNLTLEGEGGQRVISSTRIGYKEGKDFDVWVSVLAAPGIWYEQKISELDPVKDKKLDWKVPFRALWRADFRRVDGLIDSWAMVIKKQDGRYDSFGISLKRKRTVWASARSTYAYPACIEGDSAYLRKSRFEGLPKLKYRDDGKVVIYPFQRISGSPATAYGVMDVLLEALRDTPESKHAENLLRIQRVPRDRYPATCGVTAEYEKIFDAKEEKAKKAKLLERLDAMDHFVVGIRSRIDEYTAWGKQVREFCAKEKAATPQLAPLIDELDGIVAKFDEVWERLHLKERNPAAAKVLIQKVIDLIDSNEDKKDEKAKLLGRETRLLGGSQDHSIGDFRVITKELRQRAGYRMMEAKDDASFDFAREMRDRTMEMLHCGFGHEGLYTN